MKTLATTAYRVHLLGVAALVLATVVLGASTASAQTPPTPTHTFQPAAASGVFGTNTNWSNNTLPVAGSQVLIADGKTATMTQANADTLFGSLTLGTNSVISLGANVNQGLQSGSVIYFNDGSQLNYTSGGTNRANTYNIVSGATAGMLLGASGGDALPQGSMVGASSTVVNLRTAITLNMRLNASSFNGTLNYRTNVANNARALNFSNSSNLAGSGTTNIDTFVRVTASRINWMSDSGTLQLTGSSGAASNVKFDQGANTDTIGNFVIDSPVGATASAPTLRGSATSFTVSGTTTFQGTAGAVNFDSSNATPSSHNLITTGNMTFGGTGTWAVSGDGVIRLNAASGTRTITTNTNASIANILAGTQDITKAGDSSLTLTGINTFNGNLTIAAGALSLGSINNAGSTGVLGAGTSAVLLGSAGGVTGTLEYTGPSASSSRAFTAVTGGTARFNVTSTTTTLTLAGLLTANGNLVFDGLGSSTISGNISSLSTGSVTKNGAGSLTLNSPGHAGNFVVNEGTLNVGVNNAFGSAASLTLASGVTLDNTSGGDLTVSNTALAKNLGNSLNFTGTGGHRFSLGTGNATLSADTTFNTSAGTLAFAGDVLGSSFGITKNGNGVLEFSDLGARSATVNAGLLRLNGSIQSASLVVNAGAVLGGSGAASLATLSGAGSIDPGNSPGILAASDLVPTGGIDFNFEFTQKGVHPDWGNATASINDVLRLTSATPFTAPLDGSNAVSLYLPSIDVGDQFTGGFYTDNNANFLGSISGAAFTYYVSDVSGNVPYNGGNYSLYTGPNTVSVNTVQVPSANFAGGTATNGWSTQFIVVPEPGTLALAGLGIAGVVYAIRRRWGRSCGSSAGI
jgi:fibronectin-binding autotransporter adhesin